MKSPTHHLVREGLLALVFLIVTVGIPSRKPLLAQEKVYEISLLRARLELQPRGSYRIREEITYDFQVGSFTYAVRDLPLSNSDGVSPVTVRSADVVVENVEQEKEGDSWRVRWEFPPASGLVTFVIEYDLLGALREVKDTNEVFWRVVGSGWDVPFHAVEAEIAIPSSFALSPSDLVLDPPGISSLDDRGSEMVALFRPGALPAGRAYQVKVSFPKVMEARAVGLARAEVQATLVGLLSMVFLLLLGGIVAYRRLGPRLPVRRRPQPGADLLTAAVLLHRSHPGWDRAFPAAIFDLADRGVVALERVDRKKGLFTSQKVLLHRLPETDETLTPFESALLEELGEYEDLEAFSTKGRKFRKAIMTGVRDGLVEAGLLRDIRSEANRALLLALVVGLVSAPVLIVGAVTERPWLMAFSAAGFGICFGAAVVGSVRFARTRAGAERLADLQGFLEGVREGLKQKMKMSSISAAEYLFSVLPWLTLDPKYYGAEGGKLGRRLKKETGDLRAPPWALDRTRSFEKAAARHSAAYCAFLTTTNITGATTGAVAPAAGGGTGGAAGGGAAGGGGGGAG